jgi:hypothetical protein
MVSKFAKVADIGDIANFETTTLEAGEANRGADIRKYPLGQLALERHETIGETFR